MNDRTEVSQREATTATARRQTQELEQVLRPPVDIFEGPEDITLIADMPGVSKERLELRAERNSLVIEGGAELNIPERMDALYAEVRSTRYRRSFALSNELDANQINANLKDGVLTVRIPKRAEVRPRRIEVQTL